MLGKRPTARAEHLVACFELGYVPADHFYLAGYINAESCVPWFAQPSQYANDVRRASEETVNWIDGSRADFDQHFIVPSGRLFNLFTLENIGRTVVTANNSLHGFLSDQKAAAFIAG